MTEDSSQVRLFVAIELSDEWLAVLSRARAELERVGGNEFKWVRAELMHLTLVFLGYQDADAVQTIVDALRSAAAARKPFDLSFGNLGGFGPPHALSVLWAGLEDTPPELRGLHQSVSENLADADISFDHKPLVPHITLARGRRSIKRDVSLQVATTMKRMDLPALSATIESFVLMRSRLSPKGPSYEVVHRFPLGATHET